jgi:hypothetical protein
MYIVLYQWRVKTGKEEQFREGWRRVTEAIYQAFGSLGSRLHKIEGGPWVAYAQWPSKEHFEQAQQKDILIDEAGYSMMKDSIEPGSEEMTLCMEVTDDFLKKTILPTAGKPRRRHGLVSNLYLLLGLPVNTPFEQLDYDRIKLIDNLASLVRTSDGKMQERLKAAKQHMLDVSGELQDPDILDAYTGEFEVILSTYAGGTSETYRPKLGHLILASGAITAEQLKTAIACQHYNEFHHVQLGTMLVNWRFLTSGQLEYLLKLQNLLMLSPGHPDRWGRRLFELGLLSEDELTIAQRERELTKNSLRKVVVSQGYLTKQAVELIG